MRLHEFEKKKEKLVFKSHLNFDDYFNQLFQEAKPEAKRLVLEFNELVKRGKLKEEDFVNWVHKKVSENETNA